MATNQDRDYILGTHDEEIERLGLQHRVWRPKVLESWRNAGIRSGSRVIDIGAGPGFATIDLAEIVGSTGYVLALERSERFVRYASAQCEVRGLNNVEFRNIDLMLDKFDDISGLDAAWCRWVAAFVSSPEQLIASIAGMLKPGGRAIFYEYIDYSTYRISPRSKPIEEFVNIVMEGWRDSGGEPDIALDLPKLLTKYDFEISSLQPIIYVVPKNDPIWQWPSSFIETHLQRLLELGKVTGDWVTTVKNELRMAEANSYSLMITPLVLEIIARKK